MPCISVNLNKNTLKSVKKVVQYETLLFFLAYISFNFLMKISVELQISAVDYNLKTTTNFKVI